jgi:predicted nucleic acid-binding Zn ribbon protein
MAFVCECGASLWQVTNNTLHRCLRCERRYTTRVTVELVPLRDCANDRCGKQFVRDDPRQQYCSDACRNRARQRRHYLRHRATAAPVPSAR